MKATSMLNQFTRSSFVLLLIAVFVIPIVLTGCKTPEVKEQQIADGFFAHEEVLNANVSQVNAQLKRLLLQELRLQVLSAEVTEADAAYKVRAATTPALDVYTRGNTGNTTKLTIIGPKNPPFLREMIIERLRAAVAN